MRLLIIFMLLFLSSHSAKAQCCPYINGVTILPANPAATDTVRVVMNVTTPSQGSFIGATHSTSGMQISVSACYFSGMLPALQNYVDTLTLGVLPVGTYTLHFTARQSANATYCQPVDSTQINIGFTVGASQTPPPCCIVIEDLQLIPANVVADTQEIQLRAEIQMPAMASLHSHFVQVLGDTIRVETCFLTDTISLVNSQVDTFDLGTVNKGSYIVQFVANQGSSSAGNCVLAISKDTAYTSLDVAGPISVERFLTTPIQVYPNPFNDWVVIENYIGDYFLFDLKGIMLRHGHVTYKDEKIFFDELKSGLYILKLESIVKKIVKQ
ncbi:MAG: T9SS C-terminal target domain-containing protein [Flavobacteriales bacterium]|nr:MAG: T9SS C-terminal target domain-containing protein [Flavobacteriales bacterium]